MVGGREGKVIAAYAVEDDDDGAMCFDCAFDLCNDPVGVGMVVHGGDGGHVGKVE